MAEELPPDVRQRAVMLGRQLVEREADEEISKRLAELLGPHGFQPHVRSDEDGAVLVCVPAEWTVDGSVDPEAIEDVSRAIELPLTGAAHAEWEQVAAQNARVAARVAEECDATHAANARAFATFMSNHRARPITHATESDVEEFVQEYYPRNAWPSEAEAAVIGKSVRITRRVAEEL